MKHLVRAKPPSIPKGNPYWKGFFEGLAPDKKYDVDEWADEHRYLSQKSSAEAGRWRTDRTPYLREIMKELSPSSTTQRIVFMKGAQIGGSECGLNWLGYIVDALPAPVMAVQPVVDLAKKFSKQRIDPLFDESPRLRAKVKSSKDREAGNNMLAKNFPGGMLVITGANSAVGLRSMPARFLFMDEVDAYPANLDEEGSPIALAEARTRTFRRNRKIFLVSTPTIQGRSNIENEYEESDQRKYHVPCPHCGHMQPLEWKQIRFKDRDPETTQYLCEACAEPIEERFKTEMLAKGKWVAKYPERSAQKSVAGFHLSSLYSPVGWYSWKDAVADWIKAIGKPDALRTFVNTVLGETYVEKGDAPDWRRLYDRREPYPRNLIPNEARMLTFGVDVQKDRLEAMVMGLGKGLEKWVIDWRVFPGDTADLSPTGPWQDVRRLIQETFIREDGQEMSLRIGAIDSGFNTQTVYNFVRQYPANRVLATKGQDSLQMLIGAPAAVDVLASGKRIRRGLKVWGIGTNTAKSELYGILRLERPTDEELGLHGYPPGYLHYPEFDEDFFKQLTAEQLVKKLQKGFTRFEWQKVYERNEVLDLVILCRCAAAVAGSDRFTEDQWEQMVTFSAPIETKDEQEATQSYAIRREAEVNGDDSGEGHYERRKSTYWQRR